MSINYQMSGFKDDHGQPIIPFRFCDANNAAKALQELGSICKGLLADGVVNDVEAKFFRDYLDAHRPHKPIPPFSDILTRVEQIFADGSLEDEERSELQQIMHRLIGGPDPKASYSSQWFFDTPPPAIIFPDRRFCVTGKFAFGVRRKVADAVHRRGGIFSDSPPTMETDYLVVGTFASRDWSEIDFGNKIKHADDLRKRHKRLVIVPEQHWRAHLEAVSL